MMNLGMLRTLKSKVAFVASGNHPIDDDDQEHSDLQSVYHELWQDDNDF